MWTQGRLSHRTVPGEEKIFSRRAPFLGRRKIGKRGVGLYSLAGLLALRPTSFLRFYSLCYRSKVRQLPNTPGTVVCVATSRLAVRALARPSGRASLMHL